MGASPAGSVSISSSSAARSAAVASGAEVPPPDRSPNVAIRRVPTGPPINPPLTRPKVAAAIASVTAPENWYWSSISLPKAAPVAWPPVMVIDPVMSPRNGWTPSTEAMPTPTAFCTMASALASIQNSATWGPPCLSRPRLAPSPMDVKNATMNGDLQGGVELEAEHARLPGRQRHRRKEEAADDGRGDVEAVEHGDAPADAVAHEEHDGRQRHGLDEVELECRHGCPATLWLRPGLKPRPPCYIRALSSASIAPRNSSVVRYG